jgi:hypothetical protein
MKQYDVTITPTRLVGLDVAGREVSATYGIQIAYPEISGPETRVVADLAAEQVVGAAPVALLGTFFENAPGELQDLVQCAVENADGITVGGVRLLWNDIADELDWLPDMLERKAPRAR